MVGRHDEDLLGEPLRVEVSADIRIRASPRAVWDVVAAPGCAGLALRPGEHVHVAPGTGPGVGEVHVALRRDAPDALAAYRAWEVTVSEPEALVSRVALRLTSALLDGVDYRLAPRRRGVVLTVTSWFEAASGQSAVSAEASLARMRRAAGAADVVVLERIRARLEDGAGS